MNFIPFRQGCYSHTLAQDIHKLAEKGLVKALNEGVKDKKEIKEIVLRDDADALKRIEDARPKTRPLLSQSVTKADRFGNVSSSSR